MPPETATALAGVPHLATGLTWEEQPVGFRFRTFARTITETDLVSYTALSGFCGPLFYDARKAEAAGYSGRLVPGLLTLALAEGLVVQTNVMAGTGMGFLGMQFDVRRACCVGDTIEVVVEVTASRATRTPGRGLVTTRNSVLNQHGDVVLEYHPVRLQRGKDSAP